MLMGIRASVAVLFFLFRTVVRIVSFASPELLYDIPNLQDCFHS